MCYKTFPEGYTFLEKIDLQNNKKQFWAVNGLSFVLMVVAIAAGCFIENPIAAIRESNTIFFAALLVMLIGMVVYIIAHELTHGAFLFAFTKVKPKFGFVGWAAYCGNSAYCDKPHYAIVALAPLVVWGIVFGVLSAFLKGVWFWAVWVLQAINVSGSAGDLFVACKLTRYPKEIVVQDTGTAMTVFRRKTQEELAAERAEDTKEEDTKEEENDQ